MSRFTKQQLIDGLHKLPPDIQEIIMSEERSESFHEIMQRQELTVAQIAAVADALAPVTFGLVLPKELPSELRRALPTLESAKIDALVADINTTLLAPIRTRVMEAAHEAKAPLTPTVSDQVPAAAQTMQTAAPQTPAVQNISRTLGADMMQAKTEGTFHLPSDTVTVQTPPSVTPLKPMPAAPVQDGKYAAADPYREPTN